MHANIGLGETVRGVSHEIQELFVRAFGSPDAWDATISPANWAEATNKGNELLKSPEFEQLYESLLALAASHMGKDALLAQATPTFRVQIPGSKSVAFHTDDLSSGHGRDIVNFWLPLSKINSDNCLWLTPQEGSQELLRRLAEDGLSLAELDMAARAIAEPQPIDFGEMLCFSNKILHGTVVNKSKNVRMSLDFRCIDVNADLGTRVVDVDFRYWPFRDELSMHKIDAISVIYQSNRVAHIGHGAQRAVINDFAKKNQYRIVGEISEWHHLNHYPALDEIMTEFPNVNILIFSRESFDWAAPKGRELHRKLLRHRGSVHFVLENDKVS